LFFVRALADRLRNVPIIVNAVDPGYAISELRRNVQEFSISLYFYFMDLLLALPAEKSSRRLVWGALGKQEDEEKMHGAYIGGSQIVEPSDFVLSDEGQQVQEKIWVCAPCIIKFCVFNK
jgi:retinol dehydrogenase-12